MPQLPKDDKPEDDDSPRFDDNGPDLDAILDRELTLVPGARPPKEADDKPPELPPKLSRRQNGVLDLGTGAGGGGATEEPPPAVPRRKDKASNMVTIYIVYRNRFILIIFFITVSTFVHENQLEILFIKFIKYDILSYGTTF